MDKILKFTGSVMFIGLVIWLITGAIFRFSFIGKVCSGDFVVDGQINQAPFTHSTGWFMKWYLAFIACFFGFFNCCMFYCGAYLAYKSADA